MTEEEWLACEEPQPMLEFLRGKVSDRKLRLFGCACCRRIWHHLVDERNHHAVDVAERYADGLDQDDARRSAEEHAETVRLAAQAAYDAEVNESTYAESDEVIAAGWTLLIAVDAAAAARSTALSSADSAARQTSNAAYTAQEWDVQATRWRAGKGRGNENTLDFNEKVKQAALLRCIFGPLLFRSIILDPSWRTSTVTSLATAIYEERAFDRLPILADALEDCGCSNQEVLSHLRSGAEHTKGCWPLDLVLGKE